MSSKHIKNPEKVRLIICIIYSYAQKKALSSALVLLKRRFGNITARSEEYDFSSITDYYQDELGKNLKRRIFAYSLINPDKMPEIKLFANSIEDSLTIDKKRTINIDPGYISITNVALMSTKNFTHRIYLRNGIYAELTLMFKKDNIQEFDWTYPDFRLDMVKRFLLIERIKLLNKRKIENKKG